VPMVVEDIVGGGMGEYWAIVHTAVIRLQL
jgi:hypothetical protein